ncbi:MAG TPA: enoyl-CoA hydratase/isomerase family protein [Terriglobales bacterium]
MSAEFSVEERDGVIILTLVSNDTMNRLTRSKVNALTGCIRDFSSRNPVRPLVITGRPYFSAGADLNEIVSLEGPSAVNFAKMGQALMNTVENYPVPVLAAIYGYCMGGGLDLALSCHRRIAHAHAVFGHRGAALGLITGWGGTQRLTRLVGKGKALEMFVAAEKIHAPEALRIGLVSELANDPVAAAVRWTEQFSISDF